MNAWTVPGYVECRELGSGAAGRVVLAVHAATGVQVAVKYLGERLRAEAGFLREFQAEAQLLGGLDSPHVVGLYEYVEAPQGAAIVMELVDGLALRALLARGEPLGPEAALVLLKGSLLGLAAAHRAGVVHRDYKPENVLVAADGTSKLVDFGIAARHGTTPGVAGTPAYMAPEQWSGEPASPAADVYAATATFFECLTGRKPFPGATIAELALQHVTAPVPEEVAPEPVRPLIRRGLAKTPQERPENAEAFVAELEEVAGAAYGPDWEERGQRRLAALAALLPLLFPSAGGAAAGTAAKALTVLARLSRWKPGLRGTVATAAALVAGLVLAVAAGAADEGPRGGAAHAAATTSAVPHATPGTPVTSSSASASASPSHSPAASGSATPSASAAPSAPSASSSPVASAKPSMSASASASAPAPVSVTSVSVSSLVQTGTADVTASVDVATDGPGQVTVTVTWYSGTAKGTLGTADGSQSFTRSGSTQYTIPLSHTFSTRGCYWGVEATTDPAAANGASSQQIQNWGCALR
jgi:eukaryotic-like serine/threonine-protein kinase